MPTFRSQVHHSGLRPDELVEIADDEVPRWAGEIKLGFLVPVDWDAHAAIRTFDDEDSAAEPWDVGEPDADVTPEATPDAP